MIKRQQLIFFVIALTFIISSSCKKDKEIPEPELTAAQKATDLLTANGGKWNPAPLSNWVTVEGVNITDLFKDFSITFTATGYTTSGTTPVWARSDTWSFKDDTGTIMVRKSDSKEVTVEVTETSLKLIMTWDQVTYEGGRIKSINGKHEFNLVK
jgi:hypothetical protein